MLVKVYEFIDANNINLINSIFIGFTTIIVFFGSIINLIEDYLPAAIRQSFRYGKHSFQGQRDALVSRLEVPKGWFKHFYVFAFSWSLLALFLLLKGLILNTPASEAVMMFLDFVAGGAAKRKANINSTHALVAAVLMTLQCGRRFYETNFVQIFSKKSKINLSHYLVGYIHYFGAIVALLANTEGFVRDTTPSTFGVAKLNWQHYVCIFLFHTCWTQQFRANMILVELRKDKKTGQVNSEQHLLPKGGFFELVSSPHMFFEVVMYIVLCGFMWPSFSWRLVVFWVLSNQMANALLTHKWYKENFKNYPTKRKAIIPFLL